MLHFVVEKACRLHKISVILASNFWFCESMMIPSANTLVVIINLYYFVNSVYTVFYISDKFHIHRFTFEFVTLNDRISVHFVIMA
jgi:hypothetical protein